MTDNRKKKQKLSENKKEKFEILEQGIDMQTQLEYIEHSHSFDYGELTEEETMQLGDILLNPKTKIESRKKVLALLAHLGTVTAFRQIEKYLQNPDKELIQWAILASQECKMFLEANLTEQCSGIISTGLGGINDKLRYFILVLSHSGKPFTEIQKKIISDEFKFVAKGMNCVVEAVDQSDYYAGLTVLVPMDVALGTFVESGIEKCNELGVFLLEYYYATNQDIPDKSEIPEIIHKVRN